MKQIETYKVDLYALTVRLLLGFVAENGGIAASQTHAANAVVSVAIKGSDRYSINDRSQSNIG